MQEWAQAVPRCRSGPRLSRGWVTWARAVLRVGYLGPGCPSWCTQPGVPCPYYTLLPCPMYTTLYRTAHAPVLHPCVTLLTAVLEPCPHHERVFLTVREREAQGAGSPTLPRLPCSTPGREPYPAQRGNSAQTASLGLEQASTHLKIPARKSRKWSFRLPCFREELLFSREESGPERQKAHLKRLGSGQKARNVTFRHFLTLLSVFPSYIKGNRRHNYGTKSRRAQEYPGLYRRAFFARA